MKKSIKSYNKIIQSELKSQGIRVWITQLNVLSNILAWAVKKAIKRRQLIAFKVKEDEAAYFIFMPYFSKTIVKRRRIRKKQKSLQRFS